MPETSKERPKPSNQQLILEQTVKTLASLNSLITQAAECLNESTLIFHILNNSISYIHYDRAILIAPGGKKILGVSGTSRPARHSHIATCLRQLPRSIKEPETSQIITDESFKNIPEFWEEYSAMSGDTSAVWLPLMISPEGSKKPARGTPILILERWNKKQWRSSDLKLLAPLQKGYSSIWGLHRKNLPRTLRQRGRKVLVIFLIIAALLFLQSYKVSERIVAPCEIVPEDPASVTTAIDGVIEEILVYPGDSVEKNQELIRLNQDIFKEDYTAAEQQVKISRSELARTQAQAVRDLEARSRIQTLENQLQMDQTRLRIASYKIKRSRITAPRSGVVMMNDPNEWEGRPVMTGERIMLIITPSENKIKIYLPLDDKIDFPQNAPVKIILNTDSATSFAAHLSYLADHSTLSPTGIPSFLAEAKFDQTVSDIRMGIQGTAIIYGRKVSLGYWLIRRPLAALRNLAGI